MRYEQRKKKKSRWVLVTILVLTLMINGNTLGEVHGVEYTAAIGDQNYQTLDEAIAAVAEGETIRLLSPIEFMTDGESVVVNKPDVSFNLDLGKQFISGTKDGALLQVDAGNLTVYNGEIINSLETGGLAVSDNVLFPIGYQKPEIMGSSLNIPAAYRLEFTNSDNGSIRYGSIDGVQVPLAEGNLYAGESTAFSFFFVPDVGYKVDSFTINGDNQPIVTQYDISDLTEDQSINVNFSKITFTIEPLAYANNAVSKLGLSQKPSPATVEYGGSQTFTYTVRNGFRLIDVLVNDVSIGPVTTIELNNITTPQNVKIMLEKTAIFIMLDAGHFENYNHSPVLSSYYEGNTMWVYHKYLEQSLELYTNIIVDTTRVNNSRAIGEALLPSQRGAMGAGYDLVLSVHSNAASTSSADHPVAIYTLDPRYSSVSKTLGLKLATKVAEIMKTYQGPEVYSKAQSDGRDWYGINRGATDVGVPSIILEHSFHTNYRATVWLSSDANLRTLAVAEAKVIADYYGITGQTLINAPATPVNFAVYNNAYNSLMIRWSLNSAATGYEIYRSTSATTGYIKVDATLRNYYLNAALVTGKTYYYKVRAYKTIAGKTVYSGFTSVRSGKPIPNTPTETVIPGVKKATISWTYVPGATGYQIYRAYGTSGKYYKVKTIYNGGTLKWTNYSRVKGKVYTYKVRAYRVANKVTTFGYFSTPKSVRIK